MVGVSADAEVERLLSGSLDHVLVGANTGGFESLGAQLLILVGDEVDAERELVDVGALTTEVEDANLGVGDTTVEAGLGVGLKISKVSLLISKENSRASTLGLSAVLVAFAIVHRSTVGEPHFVVVRAARVKLTLFLQ